MPEQDSLDCDVVDHAHRRIRDGVPGPTGLAVADAGQPIADQVRDDDEPAVRVERQARADPRAVAVVRPGVVRRKQDAVGAVVVQAAMRLVDELDVGRPAAEADRNPGNVQSGHGAAFGFSGPPRFADR